MGITEHQTAVGHAIAEQRELGTPEQRLADLLDRRLQTRVSAARLRSFLLANWHELSVLAHAVKRKSEIAQRRAVEREHDHG